MLHIHGLKCIHGWVNTNNVLTRVLTRMWLHWESDVSHVPNKFHLTVYDTRKRWGEIHAQYVRHENTMKELGRGIKRKTNEMTERERDKQMKWQRERDRLISSFTTWQLFYWTLISLATLKTVLIIIYSLIRSTHSRQWNSSIAEPVSVGVEGHCIEQAVPGHIDELCAAIESLVRDKGIIMAAGRGDGDRVDLSIVGRVVYHSCS